jgi:hypothetical protein
MISETPDRYIFFKNTFRYSLESSERSEELDVNNNNRTKRNMIFSSYYMNVNVVDVVSFDPPAWGGSHGVK